MRSIEKCKTDVKINSDIPIDFDLSLGLSPLEYIFYLDKIDLFTFIGICRNCGQWACRCQ